MGYKICTPGVQHFLGYEMVKWGIVPQNGVRLAALFVTYLRGHLCQKIGRLCLKNGRLCQKNGRLCQVTDNSRF